MDTTQAIHVAVHDAVPVAAHHADSSHQLQQAVDSLSHHAAEVAHALVLSGQSRWDTDLWHALSEPHHHPSLELYPHHFPSEHLPDVRLVLLQHMLIQTAMDAAWGVRVPAPLDVSARARTLMQQLPAAQAEPMGAAVKQLECATNQALHQACMQITPATQMPQAAQSATQASSSQVLKLLHSMLAEANKVVSCAVQQAYPSAPMPCLHGLVQAAMQVVLLTRSQPHQSSLCILHHQLVGQAWQEGLMEQPVMELPWYGNTRVVLACLRPGVQLVNTDVVTTGGQCMSSMLVKSQVVMLVPDITSSRPVQQQFVVGQAQPFACPTVQAEMQCTSAAWTSLSTPPAFATDATQPVAFPATLSTTAKDVQDATGQSAMEAMQGMVTATGATASNASSALQRVDSEGSESWVQISADSMAERDDMA